MKRKRVPDDADLLFAKGEGHFKFLAWRHRQTDAITASCIGQLNEAGWDDESDPLPILLEGREFLLGRKPATLVWDLAQLEFISASGLAWLENCQGALCALGCETTMVVNRRLVAHTKLAESGRLTSAPRFGGVNGVVPGKAISHR